MEARIGRPVRLGFALLPDKVHNAMGHFNGPCNGRPAHGKTAGDLRYPQIFLNQPEQFIEHAQRKTRDTQKWVGQNGKRSSALIVFAQVPLDIDPLQE